ncbi:MAG: hypothetical protein OXQ32_11955 [bacterium]|nr:hypothetical protein [bacterium]
MIVPERPVPALVHAACIRDGLPIPERMLGRCHPSPVTVSFAWSPRDRDPFRASSAMRREIRQPFG